MLNLALACCVSFPAPQNWPGIDDLPALVRQHGLQEDADKLTKALAVYTDASKAGAVPTTTQKLFAEPLVAPRALLELTDQLEVRTTNEAERLPAMLAAAATLLDLPPVAVADQGKPSPDETTMPAVTALLTSAGDEVEAALAALQDEERAALPADLRTLLDDFVTHIYIETNKEHSNPNTWRRCQKIDAARLLNAATLLLPLLQTKNVNALAAAMRKAPPTSAPVVPGVTGRLLFAQETKRGWILVGGSDANTYDVKIALVLDLGGNDTYTAKATRSDLDVPINVVLDLAGDDTYRADEPFAQGCGLLGVSFLYDAAGKDTYAATRAGQGCGICGIGLLIDDKGDDHYTGDAFVQGAGMLGYGLLLDRAGNDIMQASINSQGFALPRAVGLLIDSAGNDQRTATGKYPSSYGTEGQWCGNSQGAAFGFRGIACGGFGVLIDGGGDDVSRVGEFGFGIGYFFGTGIVRDRGGNDEVHASRYGIATGAHCGVGAVFDDAGNDLRDNRNTASLAGNWDITLSYLFDRAGDDHYLGDGITLGGATITSLAVLVDGAGKDTYETGSDLAFGGCGHSEDVARDTKSMAVFLDLGGGKDVYPAKSPLMPPPANGVITVRHRDDKNGDKTAASGVGLFVDR